MSMAWQITFSKAPLDMNYSGDILTAVKVIEYISLFT